MAGSTPIYFIRQCSTNVGRALCSEYCSGPIMAIEASSVEN